MTPTETATILRQFAQWLRADKYLWGASLPGVSAEVGAAIESAIEMIERIPSRIAPEQAPGYVRNYSHKAAEGYADGWNACIKTIMEESK